MEDFPAVSAEGDGGRDQQGTPGFDTARRKRHREAVRLSQSDLGRRAGMRRDHISKYEPGQAGLNPIRLHDLRHGAASFMLAADVDVKIVQETLGHVTSAYTRDTDTSVYPELAKAAAENTAALVRVHRDGY